MATFLILAPFAAFAGLTMIASASLSLFAAAAVAIGIVVWDAVRGQSIKMLTAGSALLFAAIGCYVTWIDGNWTKPALHLMIDLGVLAIALAKRTRTSVIASDIDPISVTTTIDNAEQNGVGKFIIAIEATGLTHPTIAQNGPYDLIVANNLAGPLMALAPAVGRAAEKGATIILSGILQHQAQGVINAYARQGMTLTQKLQRKDWTTLMLEMK